MARTDTLGHFLTDVADAIRTKTGSSETITASDFDTEIENIPSGGDLSDYFLENISGTSIYETGIEDVVKKLPNNMIVVGDSLARGFRYLRNLQEIPFLDTSDVVNMSGMCQNCASITSFPLLDTSKVTDMSSMFSGCSSLTRLPLINTMNVTNMLAMFYGCKSLIDLPILNTTNVVTMSNMFAKCEKLSDDSINNILKMCINATNITSNKTLKYIGLSSTQANTCTTLSNYQNFVDAGWTTGY